MINIDVINSEKICCSYCNKEIGKDDEIIFVNYPFNHCVDHIIRSKYFCCVECAKLDEPLLETFINDMNVKHYKSHSYNSNSIFFTDDIEEETEQTRINTLCQSFGLIVDKYNTHEVYIELNTTLNKLKERVEEKFKR